MHICISKKAFAYICKACVCVYIYGILKKGIHIYIYVWMLPTFLKLKTNRLHQKRWANILTCQVSTYSNKSSNEKPISVKGTNKEKTVFLFSPEECSILRYLLGQQIRSETHVGDGTDKAQENFTKGLKMSDRDLGILRFTGLGWTMVINRINQIFQ